MITPCNFTSLQIGILSTSCEISLKWVLQNIIDDESILVPIMVRCHQVASHYLSQYWPRSMWPYGITRPQWLTDSAMISRQPGDFWLSPRYVHNLISLFMYLCWNYILHHFENDFYYYYYDYNYHYFLQWCSYKEYGKIKSYPTTKKQALQQGNV